VIHGQIFTLLCKQMCMVIYTYLT